MLRSLALVFTTVLALSACSTTVRSGGVPDAAGSAAPGPDLVGTWRGSAIAVGGSNYGISTPVELTIQPDGTWSWSKRGQRQASGRVRVQGSRVLLDEDTAVVTEETIQLQRRGDELWGVSPAFIAGFASAVNLQTVAR